MIAAKEQSVMKNQNKHKEFQLYLLSFMRVDVTALGGALLQLGASEAELKRD
jgi:hypothetical protein